MNALGVQDIKPFLHGRAGRTEIDHAQACRFSGFVENRLRNEVGGRFEFALEPLHVVDVIRAALRVPGVRITRGAPGEVRTLVRVGAWQRAPGDPVAVDVLVASEILAGFEFFGGHDFAAVILARIVPVEGLAQALVHADVEVGHEEDGRLQPVGEIQRRGAEFEAFVWIFREQQYVLGVAVRGIGATDDIGLLGARGHAG